MQLRPLQDRVVVQRLEEETKTAGGIIIPDSHTEKLSKKLKLKALFWKFSLFTLDNNHYLFSFSLCFRTFSAD